MCYISYDLSVADPLATGVGYKMYLPYPPPGDGLRPEFGHFPLDNKPSYPDTCAYKEGIWYTCRPYRESRLPEGGFHILHTLDSVQKLYSRPDFCREVRPVAWAQLLAAGEEAFAEGAKGICAREVYICKTIKEARRIAAQKRKQLLRAAKKNSSPPFDFSATPG